MSVHLLSHLQLQEKCEGVLGLAVDQRQRRQSERSGVLVIVQSHHCRPVVGLELLR